MLQFLGRIMKLPLEAFVYSMEMFVKTMQGMQQIAYQGIDLLADGGSRLPVATVGDESDVPRIAIENAREEVVVTTPQTMPKEDIKMPDKDLSGEDLKLVRYKILFIKRDYEWAFKEQEELVYDNTTDAAFTAWKVGEFIQHLSKDKYEFPDKWEKSKELVAHKSGNYLKGLPEDDKKYLRVYFEVLERYPREPLRYQEEQLDILRGISDTLTRVSVTPPPSPPTT